MNESDSRLGRRAEGSDETVLRRYLAATNAMGPHWRADGQVLTFVWNETGSYQVYVAELNDGTGVSAATVTAVAEGEDRCTDPRYLETGDLSLTLGM